MFDIGADLQRAFDEGYEKGKADEHRWWSEHCAKCTDADRPQEWIPCSERLPKKERATYLICTEGGYMCSCRWTNDMYGLGSNEWSEWGWHIMDKPQYAKVVAWMEMEPWKGADDEVLRQL